MRGMTVSILAAAALSACAGRGGRPAAAPTDVRSGTTISDSAIVALETAKWERVNRGESADSTLYAEGFLTINYAPGGSVLSQMQPGRPVAPRLPLHPREPWRVTDVHVIRLGTNGAVVTYRAEGTPATGPPLRLLATSVWARRGGRWATVFYQATPAAPQ